MDPKPNPRRARITVGGNEDFTHLTTGTSGRRAYNPYEEVGFELEPHHRQNPLVEGDPGDPFSDPDSFE